MRRSPRAHDRRARPAALTHFEFDYAAADPSLWGAALDTAREGGARVAVIPVSWAFHEVRAGRFDFTTASRGLRRLLELVGARSLTVRFLLGGSRARPVDIPARLAVKRGLFARNSVGEFIRTGAASFVPCAASSELLRERHAFIDALAAMIAEQLASTKLSVEIDSGGTLFQFDGLGPFDLDYHPAARALYWYFLEERYGTIADLNAEYGAAHDSFSSIEPVTTAAVSAPGELPRLFDWAAFQEYYRLWAAVKLRETFSRALGATGAGVVWSCTLPSVGSPFSRIETSRLFDRTYPPLERRDSATVLHVVPREYRRLRWLMTPRGAGDDGAPVSVPWGDFGFLDDIPRAFDELVAAWRLTLAELSVDAYECDGAEELLASNSAKAVILPTFDFIGAGSWRIVEALVEKGMPLIAGPRVPWLSGGLRPYARVREALRTKGESTALWDSYKVGRGEVFIVRAGAPWPSMCRRALLDLAPRLGLRATQEAGSGIERPSP